MDTLKITITIPRSVAVAAGRSQYGALEYQISDADLASLSVEERAWLNDHLHFDGRMTRSGHGPIPLAIASTTVEWAVVAAALRATMVDDAAWEAEQAAKTEAPIQAAPALITPVFVEVAEAVQVQGVAGSDEGRARNVEDGFAGFFQQVRRHTKPLPHTILLIFFEVPMNGQLPRYSARRIFFIRMAVITSTTYSIINLLTRS